MPGHSKITVVEIFGEHWNIEFWLNKNPWVYSIHLYKENTDYPPQFLFYRAGKKHSSVLGFAREYNEYKSEFGMSPKEARRIILKVLTNDSKETS